MVDTYTMKIPKELKDVIKRYINHPSKKHLGYRTVSQYLLDVLRQEADKIVEELKKLD